MCVRVYRGRSAYCLFKVFRHDQSGAGGCTLVLFRCNRVSDGLELTGGKMAAPHRLVIADHVWNSFITDPLNLSREHREWCWHVGKTETRVRIPGSEEMNIRSLSQSTSHHHGVGFWRINRITQYDVCVWKCGMREDRRGLLGECEVECDGNAIAGNAGQVRFQVFTIALRKGLASWLSKVKGHVRRGGSGAGPSSSEGSADRNPSDAHQACLVGNQCNRWRNSRGSDRRDAAGRGRVHTKNYLHYAIYSRVHKRCRRVHRFGSSSRASSSSSCNWHSSSPPVSQRTATTIPTNTLIKYSLTPATCHNA